MIGVPKIVKYTTFGLKKGKIVAVASRFWGPKMTGRMEGIPTSIAMLTTSFAMEFEFGILRNRKRSKATPMAGPMTTTESRKASKPDQPRYLGQAR